MRSLVHAGILILCSVRNCSPDVPDSVLHGMQGSRSSTDSSTAESGSGSGGGSQPPDMDQVAARAAARAAAEAEVAKGQRTAVITGAVSIVFGVCILTCKVLQVEVEIAP